MPNPVSYNSSTTPTGTFKRSNISYGLMPTNYGVGYGSLSWYNSLDTTSKYVIIADTYTLGLSTQGNAKPVMWSTGNTTNQNLIDLINGLPGNTTNFTDYYAAVNWLQGTNKFLLLNNGYENIVTNGLVLNLDAAWWNSYPTTGTTWTDLSNNGLTNILQNGVSYNPNNGGYMSFDGVDDKIQGPDNSLVDFTTTDNFSLETFCYAAATNNMIPIIERYWWATEGKGGFGIRLTNYGGQTPPVFFITGVVPGVGQTDYGVSSLTTWSPNTWYHIVGTKNSSGVMKIYINGTLENTNVTNNIIPLTSMGYPLMIGARGDTRDQYAVSRIPIVRIYRKELNAPEVLQNYNAQKGRFGL